MKLIKIILILLSALNIQHMFSAAVAYDPTAGAAAPPGVEPAIATVSSVVHKPDGFDWIDPKLKAYLNSEAPYGVEFLDALDDKFGGEVSIMIFSDLENFEKLLQYFADKETNTLKEKSVFKTYIFNKCFKEMILLFDLIKPLKIFLQYSDTPIKDIEELIIGVKEQMKSNRDTAWLKNTLDKLEEYKAYLEYKARRKSEFLGLTLWLLTRGVHAIPPLYEEILLEEWQKEYKERKGQ